MIHYKDQSQPSTATPQGVFDDERVLKPRGSEGGPRWRNKLAPPYDELRAPKQEKARRLVWLSQWFTAALSKLSIVLDDLQRVRQRRYLVHHARKPHDQRRLLHEPELRYLPHRAGLAEHGTFGCPTP